MFAAKSVPVTPDYAWQWFFGVLGLTALALCGIGSIPAILSHTRKDSTIER